jgi:hypothetical protein
MPANQKPRLHHRLKKYSTCHKLAPIFTFQPLLLNFPVLELAKRLPL